jgi:hypothetical protein
MKVGSWSINWCGPLDPDHHMYGAPVEIWLRGPKWTLELRPFSNFVQGGDRRGMTDFHGYEKTCRWDLSDQNPDLEKTLVDYWWHQQYCRNCKKVLDMGNGRSECPEGDHADRLSHWRPRYWRYRYRDETWRYPVCRICLLDEETCRVITSTHECVPIRWFVYLRHLVAVDLRRRKLCGRGWVLVDEDDTMEP